MGNTLNKVKPVKTISKKKFILGIIDPQYDFFSSGALAVQDAESIIGPINKLRFECKDIIKTFVSQDWHPPSHMSFASTHQAKEFTKKDLVLCFEDDGQSITITQDMWPTHCVQETPGAKIHKDIVITPSDKFFRKGTNPFVESYSAFGDEFSNQYENTGLNKFLKSQGITDIVLVGLATDFCVVNTGLDAIRLGYSVHLIKSCVRAVFPDKLAQTFEFMESKGFAIYEDIEDFFSSSCLHLPEKN
jgi:nicotinamidase/pyrazinamidase